MWNLHVLWWKLWRLVSALSAVITWRVKVKSLCSFFNWAPHHEGVLGEWSYSSTHSLTSALDGGERSASRPGCFTPRERVLGTHWIGGWVGPRAFLDAVVKKNSQPLPGIEHVGELISEFPLPKLGGTCRIINNICRLLRAVTHTHTFELTYGFLTKALRGLWHLFLVSIVGTTVLPIDELTVEQNQFDWKHKIKNIPW
jgi:hypothetical protein